MTSAQTNKPSQKQRSFWGHPVVITLLVWMLFLAYSTIRTSFPGVNEPHYLCKAKHFWDSQWCANDFFFKSSNPHFVYYMTLGSLTQFLSLPVTAVLGRLIAIGVLALGWTAFLRAIFQRRGVQNQWEILFTTALFLSFQSIVHWSGEWVVGGAEAKVVAYGFIFWSIGLVIQKRWFVAALCAGLAISFHPVIGLWSLFAIIGACLVLEKPWHNLSWFQKNKQKTILVIFLLAVCSLPGLIPAASLFLETKDPELTRWVDYTQVFNRLKHHLDPFDFKAKAWWVYGIFLVIWAGLEFGVARKKENKNLTSENDYGAHFFRWYLVAALFFAACGIINAFRLGPPEQMPLADFRVKLMKFYPFRLFDLMMPIGLAISRVRFSNSYPNFQKFSSNSVMKFGLLLALILFAFYMPERQSSWRRMPESRRVAWREACFWLRDNTPEQAVIIPPRGNFAFKWYSHRAAYVTRKDCPQDAQGIYEWDQRMKALQDWRKQSLLAKDKRYHFKDLIRLRELTGSDYFMVDRPKRKVDGEPVFANATYRIYDLRNLSEATKE